jgi:hypothetical protein
LKQEPYRSQLLGDTMTVEIFDPDSAPLTRFVIEIYNSHDGYMPNWWLEIPPDDQAYDVHELNALSEALGDAQSAVANLYDMLVKQQ